LDEGVLASCYTFQLHTTKKGGEKQNKQWCTGAMIIAKKNKTKQKTNKKKTGKAKVIAVFLH